MNTKERFSKALNRKKPDRLPVTTHHLMPYFLNKYYNGISNHEFFKITGMDPIEWIITNKPDVTKGDYYDPTHTETGFLEAFRISNENWKFKEELISEDKFGAIKRFKIITPKKELSMVLKTDIQSTWVLEHLIKEKNDIDIIAKYMTQPLCDVDFINNKAKAAGDNSLIRGHVICFDGFGQPGTWQDASCLYGIQNLIMETFNDPEWVQLLLEILNERKITFVRSLKGADYDILELGGGDASTTVISPDIFESFVAPYDSKIIEEAHLAGQRISYHTCGGMMPILEQIAEMNPDAMETFTPIGMGGDVNLAEAKNRIGDKVCIIGGFDQYKFFNDNTPENTRREVRRCFKEAGSDGGFILAPSDHFFDAEHELIMAYVDEAQKCIY